MSDFFEPAPHAGGFDPVAVVTACIESGARGILLDDGALPREFFDLSTGVAGTMMQRLTQYGIRMAGVVPDPSIHTKPFQDFARKANAGSSWFRFFPDREQAVAWLTTE